MKREILCQTAIDYEYPPDGGKVPVLDVYDGCQIRCPYCFQWNDPSWNQTIFIKMNFPDVLARELVTWNPADPIYLGSRGDPYQPLEDTYGLTRQTLAVLLKHEMPCFINTKADTDAFRRDFDLFSELGDRLVVCIGQTNLTHLRKINTIEALPNIQVVHELVRRGITVWVFITPVLPGITDVQGMINALPEKTPVYLDKVRIGDDRAGQRFFAYLQQQYPALEPLYRNLITTGTVPYYEELRAQYQDNPRVKFVFGDH